MGSEKFFFGSLTAVLRLYLGVLRNIFFIFLVPITPKKQLKL